MSFAASVRRASAVPPPVVSQTPSEPAAMLVHAVLAWSANCPPGLFAHSPAPAPPISRRVRPIIISVILAWRAALLQRRPGAASARQGARRHRPGPRPLHRSLLDAHARDSAALCMGPAPSARGALRRRPARDDVGKDEPRSSNVVPALRVPDRALAGTGRDPVHFTACSSMRMRATVRRCAASASDFDPRVILPSSTTPDEK